MRRCVIVRGLPGSGKSTLSRSIDDEAYGSVDRVESEPAFWSLMCSTDDYFMHDGEYKFDGRQLTQAHDWNRSRFERAIRNDYDLIIVDNTNTQFWEMAAYIESALNNNYHISVVEPQTEWAFDVDRLFEKNTHGVPRKAIQAMKDRWDSLISLRDTFEEKYKLRVDATIIGGTVTSLEFHNG
jgi:adenylate kinase family enzyme